LKLGFFICNYSVHWFQ